MHPPQLEAYEVFWREAFKGRCPSFGSSPPVSVFELCMSKKILKNEPTLESKETICTRITYGREYRNRCKLFLYIEGKEIKTKTFPSTHTNKNKIQ